MEHDVLVLPVDANPATRPRRSLGEPRLSPWQRFWKLDVPYSMPGLIWNMMMSMSGGWFFVVASEAITVGDKTVTLPGIGAYLATAILQRLPLIHNWRCRRVALSSPGLCPHP